ncbi:MAG: folylpolyglutamate synthase/dihydrofolate synthase family protein [Gemmatimonadaceae bacterium]
MERTRALLEILGNPHEKIPLFHVAGTNGKGSVVATADALLRAKGLRVGRFTSPHLVDFRERIAINDTKIGEAEVDAFLQRWESNTEQVGATFFEITTALALDHFAQHDVDVAVIETGLGGRLDSTNVITPLAAAVTSIGIDHTEYLGNTIVEIAREKGGIFKRGIPAIYGSVSPEARVTLTEAAGVAGSKPVISVEDEYRPANIRVAGDGTVFDIEHDGESATLRTGLIGHPQAMNACVALAMLEAAGERYNVSIPDAQKILPSVSLPGRFQRMGKFVLDVAHNPDGIRSLVETMQLVSLSRPLAAVLGVLRDKDWREMMRIICPFVDRTILTLPPSAPASRAWDPSDALHFAEENGWNAGVIGDIGEALREAEQNFATVIVTGSFHTVGDSLMAIER